MSRNQEASVSAHYGRGGLRNSFEAALAEQGLALDAVTLSDLAPIDEFHIGGAEATEALAERAGIGQGQHWLDVGSGVGGPARHIAAARGCAVTGIDLVPEFVEVAEWLTALMGMEDRVSFRCGSALEMPFDAGSFDGAYMLHVAMNIQDKAALFAEVARVLKPGAVFAVYDVMRSGEAELAFPLPWADEPAISFLDRPQAYRDALQAAGFAIESERHLGDYAKEFFRKVAERMASGKGQKNGLHVVMGASAPAKVANMKTNVERGSVAPVEMLCRKPR
jgi:ubiquinone/menaquinone biosynthesis C-methylase UbiE